MGEYMMRISIDFGSTVSALGWMLWQKDADDHFEAMDHARLRFPTVIVEAAENPALSLPDDLFGEDAVAVLKQLPHVKAATEFKHGLYDTEGEAYPEARRLTVKFLQYLRQCLETYHGLSDDLFSSAQKEVWYTTPLISAYDANRNMQEMLLEAGFTPENGYGSFTKLDEATSLSSLALESDDSLFRKTAQELARNQDHSVRALFIDIGGLTADINLVSLCYAKNAEGELDWKIQQLASWPEPSLEQKNARVLGGGLALDQALSEYLEKNRFVNPVAVRDAVAQRGYMDFREFKEQANDYFWRAGMAPDSLNGLGVDHDRNLEAELDYECIPERQLTPERFMTEVAADYISTLTEGIRSVIRDGAAHNAARGLDIREETIDWVFLTGGGSNIFFLRPMLLGQLPSALPRLNLKKIRTEPARILPGEGDDYMLDHTMNCVTGTLMYSGEFVATSPADYSLLVTFLACDSEGDVICVLNQRQVPLMTKQDVLPLERSDHYSYDYTYTSEMKRILCQITLMQAGVENLSMVGNVTDGKLSQKNTGAKALDLGVGAAKVLFDVGKIAVPAIALVGASALLDAVAPGAGKSVSNAGKALWMNHRHEIERDMNITWDTGRTSKDSMHVVYRFAVTEERHIVCTIGAWSKAFTKDPDPVCMDFI